MTNEAMRNVKHVRQRHYLVFGVSTAFLTSSDCDAMSGAGHIFNHYGWARRRFEEMELSLSAALRETDFFRRILNRQSNEEVRYGVYGDQSKCMGR